MRLQIITERNRDDLTQAAQQLNRQVQQIGVSELQGLVRDPNRTVALIRQGMTAREYIFSDKRWVQDFLEQWTLLSTDAVEKIFEVVFKEMAGRIDSLRTRTEEALFDHTILAEGVLSGIGGFLTKLAKMAWLLLQLLITSRGGINSLDARSLADLRVFNPYAVFRLTKELQMASMRAQRNARP